MDDLKLLFLNFDFLGVGACGMQFLYFIYLNKTELNIYL